MSTAVFYVAPVRHRGEAIKAATEALNFASSAARSLRQHSGALPHTRTPAGVAAIDETIDKLDEAIRLLQSVRYRLGA